MKNMSVKKNFIYNLIYQILTIIIPFITTPYVSRILGADGIGVYSYTISIQTYFSLLAALGTSSYGMRMIAQARDNKEKYSKLFWEIELMTILTSFICLVIWVILILFSRNYKIYYIVLTMCLFATLFDISWFFSGLEEFKLIVIRNSVIKIISIICIFIFVKTKEDLLKYIFIYSAGMMIGNLSMWTYLPKFIVRVNYKNLKIRHHLKETLIYFIPTIATSIYTVLDKTLLGAITNDNYQNGYYEQATKIINICKGVIFTAINSVMGARISYLYVNNKESEIKSKIKKSIDYILLIGFGSMFGLIGVSSNFVPIFFGEGYEQVIILISLFSPILIIIGISNCLGSQYYTPSGRRAKSAKFIILGSIVNLVINLILIPYFSAIGAVISSIISEGIITILYILFCDKMITFRDIIACSYKRIIAGLIMLGIVNMINFIKISAFQKLIFQILSGFSVYFIVLLLLKDKFIIDYLKLFIEKLNIKRHK